MKKITFLSQKITKGWIFFPIFDRGPNILPDDWHIKHEEYTPVFKIVLQAFFEYCHPSLLWGIKIRIFSSCHSVFLGIHIWNVLLKDVFLSFRYNHFWWISCWNSSFLGMVVRSLRSKKCCAGWCPLLSQWLLCTNYCLGWVEREGGCEEEDPCNWLERTYLGILG